ncbi:MAG: hypothetical protein H6Q51_699 [Deltaproteobacteria bacterium]|nr:hypothetical protein [Deltaproteobacteria bacterium]
MVASVPELTRRTISMDGTSLLIIWASSTSFGVGMPKVVPCSAASLIAATTWGWACPKMRGPHEPT